METSVACPTSIATIPACQKIAKSFKENIYELSSIRNGWDPDYTTTLNERISDSIDNFYSENLAVIEDKTYHDWHEVMVGGLQSLKVVRASLKVDFKHDEESLQKILRKLGYSDFFSEAMNGDHLRLYNLLKTFTRHLDEKTLRLIVNKGVPETVINKIYESAHQIDDYKNCFITLE